MPSPAHAGALPILASLRRETRDLHELLESQGQFVDLIQGRMTRQQYAAFLVLYASHLSPVATALDEGLRDTPFHDLVEKACRLPALARDLQVLGQSWPSLGPHAAGWCLSRSLSFLVGVLYVHLGSRLGARLISAQLQACFAMTATNGAGFFATSDERHLWPDFLCRLEREVAQLDVLAAVAGARSAFSELYIALMETEECFTKERV